MNLSAWIGNKDTKISWNLRRRQGGLATLLGWLYELAFFILHSCGSQANFTSELVTDVANRVLGFSNKTRDALIAFRSHRVSRPVDQRGRTELATPLFTDCIEVFCERESRSAAILTNHGSNRPIGKFYSRIRLGDQRIVPLLDLAEKDTRISLA